MKVQGVRNTSTKKSIVEAFEFLLRKKDIDNITIKNITDEANVNRATFYAHFDDKYQLFEDMLYEAISQEINTKAGHLTYLDEKHVKVIFNSIHDFLGTIVTNCPYSFLKLFPLLRVKTIHVLQLHIYTKLTNSESNVDMFKPLMFASMLYEAAEIHILKKSDLNRCEILDELTAIIFK